MCEYARTETYYEMQGVINSVIAKFHRQFRGNWEDHESIAHLAYTRGMAQYEAMPVDKRPDLAIHIWRWVWYALYDDRRAERGWRRKTPANQVEMDLGTVIARTSFTVDALLDGLSDDAATVARMIVDPPAPVAAALAGKNETPKRVWNAVKSYLISTGWGSSQIAEIFEEIQQAL